MNNQELELKVKEILAIENFFDMIEATIAFEKEYKTTDFYKKTRMSLMDVIKNAKAWYLVNLNEVAGKIQSIINNLNFENITNIINQFGDMYAQENGEILGIINEFKDIVK